MEIEIENGPSISPNQDLVMYVPINQDIGVWNYNNYA